MDRSNKFSKYALVVMASKRSRDMQVRNNEKLDSYTSVKPYSKAIEEIEQGVITIKVD